MLKEISDVTSELRDLRQDFRKFNCRLTQIENKLSVFEKITSQIQKNVKGT